MDNIQLLVINASPNSAEQYVSELRNAGLAVQSHCLNDAEDIREALDRQDVDLILCASETTQVAMQDVVDILDDSGADTPLIVIAAKHDDAQAIELMRSGARDFVGRDHPEKLQLVVNREIHDLELRRKLKDYKKELSDIKAQCANLVEHSADAIAYIQDGMYINANPAYLNLFGYAESAELEGMPVLDRVAAEDQKQFKEFLRAYIRGRSDSNRLELHGRSSDDKTFAAVMEFGAARVDGEDCIQLLIRDQSQRKEFEERIQFLSDHDPLTGFFNRQRLIETLDQFLKSEATETTKIGLLCIDVDNFGQLEEALGLEASDRLLMDIAAVLRERSGDQDVLARFDDHAFTWLSRDRALNELQELAEDIRENVKKIDLGTASQVAVTASIGIALHGKRAANAQELLSRARLGCNTARSKGGNRAVVHDPLGDRGIESEWESACVTLIQRSLKQNLFRLLYQPIVSLHGAPGENYAVLLRMPDEKNELIQPNRFLPVAEENNLTAFIDRWVIKQTFQILSEQYRKGRRLHFFIILSVDTIRSPTLLPWIQEQLQEKGLPGEAVVFQLPESQVVNRIQDTVSFINGLKALNCQFALDNFGSGTNSSKLLEHLTVDYLEINGALIQNITESSSTIQEITAMAHSLKIRTIAKSVEDANTLALLWNTGVHYIIGNFLQEPAESLSYNFSMPAG